MINVNFGFIAALEGGQVLTGYVPDAAKSNSGVTIATGFDIGQRSDSDLVTLLPKHSDLVDKLAPYCGLKNMAAVAALTKAPLQISRAEATAIDTAVKQQMLTRLVQRFNKVALCSFADLSPALQTVIASVAFQYGDLASRCPRFWHAATTANSSGVVNELKNFGDRYPTRRQSEANYLIKFHNAGPV